MKKRILSAVLGLSLAAGACQGFCVTASADTTVKTPTYQTTARQMEKLNRGLIAVKTEASTANGTVNGVYLSWRLLGDEDLTSQAFDIYKNDTLLYTTGEHDATCYTDTTGTANDEYKVVKAGASAAEVAAEKGVTPSMTFTTAREKEARDGDSEKNALGYMDVPLQRPEPVSRMGDGKKSYYYTYDNDHEGGANDASVGDLDGDGDYELVVKWDPTDSKDSAGADFTGNVYIDGYEITTESDNLMWRIDLGQNVTAGAHYTQFIVYDFDGDGRSEIAMKTAPGSIDGTGHYVTEVGDTDTIKNADNTASYIGTSGRLKGKNPFTQYLTIFDGETGKALYTTEYIPYEMHTDTNWGDDSDKKYNRSERYLAAAAYLDGENPSLIMCRGYYDEAVIRAYDWDGEKLTMRWQYDSGSTAGTSSLYGQGNHNLSIGDIDGDGYDEIVYGSAALDNDGSIVMGNTKLGHGDAMHLSDFNNDGTQEVFSIQEDNSSTNHDNGGNLRIAKNGTLLFGLPVTKGSDGKWPDVGRGVMDNLDDSYAKTHANALSLAWTSYHDYAYGVDGSEVAAKPSLSANFLVFWDGDLGREILDGNKLGKYNASTGETSRFFEGKSSTLSGGTNNYTKSNPALVADIWGDWREEIILPIGKSKDQIPYLRIYTSTLPTEYRLTTLMHDSQYRLSVAWQNVAYNQPTHTSYYVGSAALATDDDGNELNYLAPAVSYTTPSFDVTTTALENFTIDVDSDNPYEVERGKTLALNTTITPAKATNKGVTWTSSDESIATVKNGIVTGVKDGTVTITGTTNDGNKVSTCEVTVYSIPVTGITLSDTTKQIERGKTATITATVTPSNATDTSVTWTSSDPTVATVKNGVVTAVKVGTATITAKTNDGDYTASCDVEVYKNNVTGITLSKSSLSVGVGSTSQLTATIAPSNATDTSVTWTTSDNTVATVSSTGLVTGVKKGRATITATSNDDSSIYKTCEINVNTLDTVDAVGDDVFVSDNTDSGTTFIGTANSGALIQTAATENAEFHKTFTSTNVNKAVLKFNFTTGGMQIDGSTWNWTGHEYTQGLSILDALGNNIITFEQPFTTVSGTATKAGTLTSKLGSADAVSFSDAWTSVIDGIGNIQGSAKRWIVTMEFDYETDTCNATIVGTDQGWTVENAKYTKTFSLNGASFGKISCYTTKANASATITAKPVIDNLTYTFENIEWGENEELYKKGTTDTAWTTNDLSDWTVTGLTSDKLAYDSENGRIWFNETNPSTSYSAEKSFDDIKDDAIVTYDVDWYFGEATARANNLEYIQFGDKLRLGWTSGYMTFVSTDGGKAYEGITEETDEAGKTTYTTDEEKSIFKGEKATRYTKNVKVIFDTQANTIKALYFDGTLLDAYTDYVLPEDTNFDTVSFGFTRGGSVGTNYVIPVGIDKIRVSQFVREVFPSETELTAKLNGKNAEITYGIVDESIKAMTFVAALYDGGVLKEVKTDTVSSIEQGRYASDSITFDSDTTGCTLRVFMWDKTGLAGMKPIGSEATIVSE